MFVEILWFVGKSPVFLIVYSDIPEVIKIIQILTVLGSQNKCSQPLPCLVLNFIGSSYRNYSEVVCLLCHVLSAK